MSDTYTFLDSGYGKKLEQFGPYRFIRPAAQAMWSPKLPESEWDKADASFTREGEYRWNRKVKEEWTIRLSGIQFKLSTTDFGHLGVFPEHQDVWTWCQKKLRKGDQVLNLFAYSGGATLACAQAGAEVCHLDASKGMVAWARENAVLNGLERHPIRWIVDDAFKFLKRERSRGKRYEGIILDPPTFGRGSQGQVFKIEKELTELLALCRDLLSDNPRFIALSCHTPGFTPLILDHVLADYFPQGSIECGEMQLKGEAGTLPNGTYARWSND